MAEGDLLVDGGIVDNLLADVMKEFSKGAHVIDIDVSPKTDAAMTADYGYEMSGWRALWRHVSPFAKRRLEALSMSSILMRSISFGDTGRRSTGQAFADLYIKASLEPFKFNDFKRGKEVAEVTYELALPRIRAWRAALRSPSDTAGDQIAMQPANTA